MHVKVTASQIPVSRHDSLVVPDAVYPTLQRCVAVAPTVETPAASRLVTPLTGCGNIEPQSTKRVKHFQNNKGVVCCTPCLFSCADVSFEADGVSFFFRL